MPYKNPPPCQICGKPSVGNKMCDMHYRRWKKFGNAEKTLRPKDWGQKSKHPLWHSWKLTGRSFNARDPKWEDFWAFVSDVGDRPEKHTLRRIKENEPIGPENFYWAEPILKDDEVLNRNSRYQRAWNAAHPMKVKDRYLRKKYKIGIDEYTSMSNRQGGVCAICGGEDEWFSLAVDHCHNTGKIRGLLCSKCNRGLGMFMDDRSRIMAALAYLDEHQKT